MGHFFVLLSGYVPCTWIKANCWRSADISGKQWRLTGGADADAEPVWTGRKTADWVQFWDQENIWFKCINYKTTSREFESIVRSRWYSKTSLIWNNRTIQSMWHFPALNIGFCGLISVVNLKCSSFFIWSYVTALCVPKV